MADRAWCETCERWVGGGVGHKHDLHVKEGIAQALRGDLATVDEVREAFLTHE